MINLVLSKEEYLILLSNKKLEEYRFNKEIWEDYITTKKDDENKYIVRLMISDSIADIILEEIKESEDNIFNEEIRSLRNKIQSIKHQKELLGNWKIGENFG